MKIEICAGLSFPLFPMRPQRARSLGSPKRIRQLWFEAIEQKRWVMQPKLNGDRAVLAKAGDRIYVQNRYGHAYRFRVNNAVDYLRLRDGTCFDGEVFNGNFFPFECLAYHHVCFLRAEAHERVVWAKEISASIGQPWIFGQPTVEWLLRRGANRPNFDGIVLKAWSTRYTPLGSASQTSLEWFKCLWT